MKPHTTNQSTSTRPNRHISVGPSFPLAIAASDEAFRLDTPLEQADGLGSAKTAAAAAVPASSRSRRDAALLLRQAGYLSPSAYVDFTALRYAATVIPAIALGVLLLVVPSVWEPVVLSAMMVIPFSLWVGMRSIVERQAAARTRQIAKSIPDFMSLISYCMQQGLNLPNAFTRAARDLCEAYPALAQEVELVGIQSDITTFSHALRTFRERVQIPEVDTLASVLIQSSELGTAVSEPLNKHSTTIRERQREQQTDVARRVPQRMLVPTLVLLIPASLLVFASPKIVAILSAIEAAIVR